ncbi:MAG TPA: hypothetical protein VHT03_07100 [Rhizomicrobium sp.]|jgi:hypothetical protein|nr:hypothetical protein [Rhizomicrobium sp.]
MNDAGECSTNFCALAVSGVQQERATQPFHSRFASIDFEFVQSESTFS